MMMVWCGVYDDDVGDDDEMVLAAIFAFPTALLRSAKVIREWCVF
jgi:hypothetical protein